MPINAKVLKGLQPILGIFNGILLIINTLFFGLPVMFFGLIKLASKNERWQIFWTPVIVMLCSTWAHVCMWLEAIFIRINFDIVHTGESLAPTHSYLVISNHQSMADIPVLMKAVHGQIPFMRFFAKAQLKKVPVFGLAWRAVDCPFMQRYSKEFLEQNPHLKGHDLLETIESCRRLRHSPVAITNFIEGTRFTQRKHQQQEGAYQHLLAPKAGGLALAIAALEGQLKTMVDVTLYYHQKQFELWDYLCGRIRNVTIRTRTIAIPDQFHLGDYQNDAAFRAEFQAWLNAIWSEKDEMLKALHQA